MQDESGIIFTVPAVDLGLHFVVGHLVLTYIWTSFLILKPSFYPHREFVTHDSSSINGRFEVEAFETLSSKVMEMSAYGSHYTLTPIQACCLQVTERDGLANNACMKAFC